MDFQQGFDRYQLQMMDFNSMVAADSWARVVDLFVDILPLEELGFQDILASEGRPPYHSSDLLKLYLYGYKNRIKVDNTRYSAYPPGYAPYRHPLN